MSSDLMALQEKLDDELLSQDKSGKFWSISFPGSSLPVGREYWEQGCLYMYGPLLLERSSASSVGLVMIRL